MTKEREWKVGDVLRLKSFGPKMVIRSFPTETSVLCVWMDKNDNVETWEFPRETLVNLSAMEDNNNG